MSENMEQLKKRHEEEREKLIEGCPHSDIVVEDTSSGYKRTVTLRCINCRLNLVGWSGDSSYHTGKVDYVRGWKKMASKSKRNV